MKKHMATNFFTIAWIIPCLILIFIGLRASTANNVQAGLPSSEIDVEEQQPDIILSNGGDSSEMAQSVPKESIQEVVSEYLFVGRISGSRVRFRSTPTTSDSEVIEELQDGTSVYVLEEVGGWYKVYCHDREGYVSSTFVDGQE